MSSASATPAGVADARTQTVVHFFETLTPASLVHIGAVYGDDARFIDPFNDVSGLAAVRRVFEHMFEQLHAPRFKVLRAFSDGDECMLLWDFHFHRRPAAAQTMIRGVSHLRFGTDGRVVFHQDHWDPARQIYEGLPLLGPLLRWLRRRLAAQP